MSLFDGEVDVGKILIVQPQRETHETREDLL